MPLLSRLARFFYEAAPAPSPAEPPAATRREDGWIDPSAGTGGSYDGRTGMYFRSDFVTEREAVELVRGSWLADRVTGGIVEEAFRPGFDIKIAERSTLRAEDGGEGGEDKELAEKRRADVIAAWRNLEVMKHLETALRWERIEGGAALLLGLSDNRTTPDRPPGKNAKLEWIRPVHKLDLYPFRYYSDPNGPKYGQVELWHMTPIARSGLSTAQPRLVVHESRLVLFRGRQVTDEILPGQHPEFGDGVLPLVIAAIRRFQSGLDGMELTARRHGMPWLKLADLSELLARDGGKLFQARLAAMNRMAGQIGVRVVDQRDEFGLTAAPLDGYRAIYEAFRDEVAAAAAMPKTILFGDAPGGIGDNSKGPKRDWYDTVAAWTVRAAIPPLTIITGYIQRGLGGEPAEWSVVQHPLWQESRKEKAEGDQLEAQTDAALLQAGVVTLGEVRAREIWRTRFQIEDAGLDVEMEIPDDIREPGDGGEMPAAPVDGETPVQATALNGAQTAALLGIIRSVAAGEISRESGIASMLLAFPTATRAQAEEAMGPEDFKTAPKPTPMPPGRSAAAPPPAEDDPEDTEDDVEDPEGPADGEDDPADDDVEEPAP